MGTRLNILYLSASPRGEAELEFKREARAILDAIAAQGRKELDIEACFDVRADQIQGLLRTYQPVIVHFAGHGVPAAGPVHPGSGRGSIGRPAGQGAAMLFQDEGGNAVGLSKELLRDILRYNKGTIRCVVLNACYSEEHAKEIVSTIECAVGTTGAILDAAAISFAGELYAELAAGKSVEDAVGAGCTQIGVMRLGKGDIVRLEPKIGVDPATVHIVAGAAAPAPPLPLPIDGLLAEYLKGIPEGSTPVLTGAFNRSAPNGWVFPALQSLQGAALSVARELEHAPVPAEATNPQEHGLPPLLKFLHLLSLDDGQPTPRIPAETRLDLRDWVLNKGIRGLAGDGFGDEATLKQKLDAVVWKHPDVHLHLRIEKGDDEELFSFYAYRDRQEEKIQEQVDRATLKRLVAGQIERAAADTEETRLCIEFFLDRDLLDWDLDQWTYQHPTRGKGWPLGKAGRLVVRDALRWRMKRFQARWKEAWDHFSSVSARHPVPLIDYQEGALPQGAVAWFALVHGDPEALEEQLDDWRLGCAVFNCSEVRESVLVPLLDATVPVALWARSSCAEALRTGIRDLVNQGPLVELPERVRKARRSGELGKHLTLFWDDPSDVLTGGLYTGPGTG